MEVYVRPYPGPGGRWQISTGGGYHPRWSRAARELFFETRDLRIMTVGYSIAGDAFSAGKPSLWSETRLAPAGGSGNYDLAPDGKRFAVLLARADSGDQKPLTQVTLLLNFFDELLRRLAAGGQ